MPELAFELKILFQSKEVFVDFDFFWRFDDLRVAQQIHRAQAIRLNQHLIILSNQFLLNSMPDHIADRHRFRDVVVLDYSGDLPAAAALPST